MNPKPKYILTSNDKELITLALVWLLVEIETNDMPCQPDDWIRLRELLALFDETATEPPFDFVNNLLKNTLP